MFKILFCGILLLSLTVPAFAEVPIEVLQNRLYAAPGGFDAGRIKELVKSAFQISRNEQHIFRVMVNVYGAESGLPDHLIVYILAKETYSYETARVNLLHGYRLGSIQRDYVEAPDEVDLLYDTYASCPDNTVEMVFATNLSSSQYPTAVKAVDYAASLAQSAGYNVKVLKGSAENKAAYANWLACSNLKMIGRVGHGSTSGIAVSDGTVDYNFFKGLGSSGLKNKVLYFNSCQTHNSPLEPAIVGAGVQKFVGGNVNLYVGPSEEVFKCWLNKVVSQKQAMTSSLPACEKSTGYPQSGAHGISGGGSDYCPASGSSSSSSSSSTSSSGGTACQSYTATNSQHVSAGRAYAQNVQSGCSTITNYYAVGSNQSLGSSGTTSTTLYTTDGGKTYRVGGCPGYEEGGGTGSGGGSGNGCN